MNFVRNMGNIIIFKYLVSTVIEKYGTEFPQKNLIDHEITLI